MIREQFIDYIKNNNKLNSDSISVLENLINEFPYCQSARLLYVLNLYKEKNIHYNSQLKIAAAYVYNRKNLKKLIEKLDHCDDKKSLVEEKNNADRKKEIIEQVKKEYSEKENKTNKKQTSSEEIPEKDTTTINKNKYQNSLIDKFIKDIPSISKSKIEFYNPERTADDSVTDDSDIVSETLAKLYVLQNDIPGAIKIYKKLSLNYPDKKLYFAQQIKKLEKRINK